LRELEKPFLIVPPWSTFYYEVNYTTCVDRQRAGLQWCSCTVHYW